MAVYRIEVKDNPSQIINIIEENFVNDDCETSIDIIVELQPGDSRFVTIIDSGFGGSFTGQTGTITNNSNNYNLLIEGDNTNNTSVSGTVVFTLRTQLNGPVEFTRTISRSHSGAACV